MNAATSSAAAEKSLPVDSDVGAEISELVEEHIPKRPPEMRLTSNELGPPSCG
jgi:hypothetical protein